MNELCGATNRFSDPIRPLGQGQCRLVVVVAAVAELAAVIADVVAVAVVAAAAAVG